MASKAESSPDQSKPSNRVNLFLSIDLQQGLETFSEFHDEPIPTLIRRYILHGLAADRFASKTPAGKRMAIVFRYEDLPPEDNDPMIYWRDPNGL